MTSDVSLFVFATTEISNEIRLPRSARIPSQLSGFRNIDQLHSGPFSLALDHCLSLSKLETAFLTDVCI